MGSEENPVVTSCLALAELMGFEAWRNNAAHIAGRRFNGEKGRGDILGVSPSGLALTCECKKADGKATPEQIEFAELVHRRGGYGCIVRSVQEFKDYLIPRMKELGDWPSGVFKTDVKLYNKRNSEVKT